jgi:indole-3-glycerol phosphate synthase
MILDNIAEATHIRVEDAKRKHPLEKLKSEIYDGFGLKSFHNRNAFMFERALRSISFDQTKQQADYSDRNQKTAFICEVKKASPSKGIIVEDFPYLQIAKEYEAAGAAAISVLTEPKYFQGDVRYLTDISNAVHIPVLQKDFIVDEYQLYQAKAIGADAVLLICALLDTDTLKKFLTVCNEFGLSALVEAHTEEEIQSAIKAGARVIGVNNRNLQTFEVDLHNSIRLRKLVPKDIIFVAESGIKTAEDVRLLREAGVDAVLIGETLMRCADKKARIDELRA